MSAAAAVASSNARSHYFPRQAMVGRGRSDTAHERVVAQKTADGATASGIAGIAPAPPNLPATQFEAGTVRAAADGTRWRVVEARQYRGKNAGLQRCEWELVEPPPPPPPPVEDEEPPPPRPPVELSLIHI